MENFTKADAEKYLHLLEEQWTMPKMGKTRFVLTLDSLTAADLSEFRVGTRLEGNHQIWSPATPKPTDTFILPILSRNKIQTGLWKSTRSQYGFADASGFSQDILRLVEIGTGG